MRHPVDNHINLCSLIASIQLKENLRPQPAVEGAKVLPLAGRKESGPWNPASSESMNWRYNKQEGLWIFWRNNRHKGVRMARKIALSACARSFTCSSTSSTHHPLAPSSKRRGVGELTPLLDKEGQGVVPSVHP